jgi:hypothetical protein
MTLTCFTLLSLLFLGSSSENYAAQSKPNTADAPTGTFQKMIVENGSVTMDLDLNRFNAISSVPARATTLGFAAAANSFFTILVFNDLLRSPEPGSMALVPDCRRGDTNSDAYCQPYADAYGNIHTDTDPNGNSNTYCYANGYRDSYADSYCHADSYRHGNCYPDANTNADGDTNPTAYTYTKSRSVTKGSSHSGAETLIQVTDEKCFSGWLSVMSYRVLLVGSA